MVSPPIGNPGFATDYASATNTYLKVDQQDNFSIAIRKKSSLLPHTEMGTTFEQLHTAYIEGLITKCPYNFKYFVMFSLGIWKKARLCSSPVRDDPDNHCAQTWKEYMWWKTLAVKPMAIRYPKERIPVAAPNGPWSNIIVWNATIKFLWWEI